MAPINFEDSIKEKLEKRTLEPSSEAWKKLSERMEANTKKPSSNAFWWLAIAASIVGILFVVIVFVNTPELIENTPVLVDTETEAIENRTSENEAIPNEKIVFDETMTVAAESVSEVKKEIVKTKTEPKIYINYSVKNNHVAEVKTEIEQEKIVNDLILENPSIETAFVQAESKAKINNTETEIDVLLQEAQQNLTKNTNNKDYAIDAKALLQDVEEDLDESFRAKVFETLITGYKKVKTAVAQRNQ